jgi:hypothetical protein
MAADREIILVRLVRPSYAGSIEVKDMAEQQSVDLSGICRRRRASDRARERAGRAAYLGDRAGLLIATADVAQLVLTRDIDRRRVVRPT